MDVDAYIPLKDRPLVELIKGVVLWVIWLERNRLCFNTNSNCKSIISIAAQIVSLATFWCKSRGDDLYLKLTLILPCDVKEIMPVLGTVEAQDTLDLVPRSGTDSDEDLLDM